MRIRKLRVFIGLLRLASYISILSAIVCGAVVGSGSSALAAISVFVAFIALGLVFELLRINLINKVYQSNSSPNSRKWTDILHNYESRGIRSI